MKSLKFLVLLLALLLTGCQKMTAVSQIIKINNNELKVEVVNTPQAIAKGLSGRENLCENCGMLFEFPDYQFRYFWMKEMRFPLDIIWIKDNFIVGVAENVPIFSSAGTIGRAHSNQAVNRVLEVKAGWARENKVKIGDKVIYKEFD